MTSWHSLISASGRWLMRLTWMSFDESSRRLQARWSTTCVTVVRNVPAAWYPSFLGTTASPLPFSKEGAWSWMLGDDGYGRDEDCVAADGMAGFARGVMRVEMKNRGRGGSEGWMMSWFMNLLGMALRLLNVSNIKLLYGHYCSDKLKICAIRPTYTPSHTFGAGLRMVSNEIFNFNGFKIWKSCF